MHFFKTMSETLESTAEKEIEVLETIHHADENDRQVVQRDIAHIVGVNTSGPDGGSPDGNTAFYLRLIV